MAVKPIPPYNSEYVTKVLDEMRRIHATRVDLLFKPGAPPPADPETKYSEKQKKILEGFKKWNYGCQHSEVLELVSILADIPREDLLKARKTERNPNNNRIYLGTLLKGMFVKIISKENIYRCKLPVSTVMYVSNSEVANGYFGVGEAVGTLSDCRQTSVLTNPNLRIFSKEDMSWKRTIAIATPAEIEAYSIKMKALIQYADKWRSFIKLFPTLDSPALQFKD
jgi:hypothetical protein